MSMTGKLFSVPLDWVERIEQDEDQARLFIQSQKGKGALDIGKNWHGLHFLMTGKDRGGESPLADAVFLGGSIEDEDWDEDTPDESEEETDSWDVASLEEIGNYGGQLLSPVYVAEVHRAMADLQEAALVGNFVPHRMDSLEIYPGHWTRSPETHLNDLLEAFRQVKEFYSAAAESRHGVLFYLA